MAAMGFVTVEGQQCCAVMSERHDERWRERRCAACIMVQHRYVCSALRPLWPVWHCWASVSQVAVLQHCSTAAVQCGTTRWCVTRLGNLRCIASSCTHSVLWPHTVLAHSGAPAHLKSGPCATCLPGPAARCRRGQQCEGHFMQVFARVGT